MIYLYSGSGSGGFEVGSESMSPAERSQLLKNTKILLQTNYGKKPCTLLDKFPFEVFNATNYFNDEFFVLYAKVPIQEYAKLKKISFEKKHKSEFTSIAHTITELGTYIRHIAIDFLMESNNTPLLKQQPLEITSSIVRQALEDAENLINSSSGATSAVDRAHTAFYGYLQAICKKSDISFKKTDSIMDLFKLIQKNQLNFKKEFDNENISKILRSMSAIIDSINQIRNNASIAHPNENLLSESEAILVINTIRTLLNYLDKKLKNE